MYTCLALLTLSATVLRANAGTIPAANSTSAPAPSSTSAPAPSSTSAAAAGNGSAVPPCYTHWDTMTPTLLSRIDYDRDGNVSESDFTSFIYHHISLLNLTGIKADRVSDNYMKIWTRLYECCKQEISRSTFPLVLKCLGQGNCTRALEIVHRYFYALNDLNDDDVVTVDEFIDRLKVNGRGEHVALLLFGKLDTNHDGNMSWTEYFDGHDQWLSDQDHPNVNFVMFVAKYMPYECGV